MQNIPNLSAYQEDIDAGAADFAAERGVDECPHADGNRRAAWQAGWINELARSIHTIAGVQNRAGELLQERFGGLTAEYEDA